MAVVRLVAVEASGPGALPGWDVLCEACGPEPGGVYVGSSSLAGSARFLAMSHAAWHAAGSPPVVVEVRGEEVL